MWKELSLLQPYLFYFLSFCEPKYVKTFKLGHQRLNSISQLIIIVVGTMIRWGPQIPLSQANEANKEIVWMVLPRPISSANIPLRRLLCSVTSQSRPII